MFPGCSWSDRSFLLFRLVPALTDVTNAGIFFTASISLLKVDHTASVRAQYRKPYLRNQAGKYEFLRFYRKTYIKTNILLGPRAKQRMSSEYDLSWHSSPESALRAKTLNIWPLWTLIVAHQEEILNDSPWPLDDVNSTMVSELYSN